MMDIFQASFRGRVDLDSVPPSCLLEAAGSAADCTSPT